MPVNLNPDALDAAHRHCADDGDIGNLARGLLSAAAQLEALQATKNGAPAKPVPEPDDEEEDPRAAMPMPAARKKAHVSPPRHRK